MEIGIDKISFSVPYTFVDMTDLAEARNEDPGKYLVGIGQDEMGVSPITQDSVTLGANAALNILDEDDREKVDMVLFATETGIDHSKAGAVWIHHLTGIQENARAVELKQACYSGTMALQMARGHIALNPDSKVLVVASDIARYGLETGGEPTQGAGAIAFLVSKNPKILTIEPEHAALTEDIADFWRPLYSEYARVDGKFSNEAYINFFNKVWEKYSEQTGRGFDDFEALVFHTPYTRMGRKAMTPAIEEESEETQERLQNHYDLSITYNKRIGNIYTGSLYLSLISLLEKGKEMEAGSRIGLFSYGSGAVGEFFSGILQENYKDHLLEERHEEILAERTQLSVPEYEEVFTKQLPEDNSTVELDVSNDPASVVVTGVSEDIRHYEKREA